MISLKRIIFGVVWLVTIFLIGSFGYVLLEGWSFFEGFYMTVITLTTVGYGEVRPLTQTGRTFTIMLIFLGVGFMFYVVAPSPRWWWKDNSETFLAGGDWKGKFVV